ncbi:hypothetical protein BH23BAC1_BH23BAC1_05750 [soil metagenome]
MKNFYLISALLFFPLFLKAQFPKLDPTFGEDGSITIPNFIPRSVLVQDDKKILALGSWDDALFVVRLNPDGDYDLEFGEDGKIQTEEGLNKLFLQPDGKFILAGTRSDSEFFPSYTNIVLTRYNQDGSWDTGFGTVHLDNSVLIESNPRDYRWNDFDDLTFLPDGKILVAGRSAVGKFDNDKIKIAISLFSLNNDGSPDQNFDQEGKLLVPIEPDDNGSDNKIPYELVVSDLAIQSDGKILILGNTLHQEAEGYHMFLVRLHQDGTLDTDFNEGEIHLSGMGHYELGKLVRVQNDDKILVFSDYKAEEDLQGQNTKNQIIRLQADGSLDATFAEEGILSGLPLGTLLFLSNEEMLVLYDSLFKISADGIIDEKFNADFPLEGPEIFVLQYDHSLLIARSRFIQSEDETRWDGIISRYLILSEPELPVVKNFVVINAITNDEIYLLEDGKVINLFVIDTKEINIRAFTDPEYTGSVKFTLTGDQNYTHIENVEPYALFANLGSDFFSWKPALGNYQLTATPYSEPNGKGQAGVPLTVAFSVIDVEVARIEKFTLIDAISNEEIFDLDHQINIYLDEIGTSEINIRAYTNPQITGSLKFELFRLTDFYFLEYSNIENVEPYALFRNNGNDYFSWKTEPGEYHLIATAYSEPNAQGVAGVPFDLWFNILPHRMEETGRTLSIFPNPGNDFVNISLDSEKAKDIQVKVYDLAGQEVLVQNYFQGQKGNLSLDVSRLKNKPYIIKVIAGNEVKSFRWIKE